MNAPLCDIEPAHDPMQIEPMYEKDGVTVRQYGWFCSIRDCDGYGGPVKKPKLQTVAQKQTVESGQMELEL